jgi:hypothetical protein
VVTAGAVAWHGLGARDADEDDDGRAGLELAWWPTPIAPVMGAGRRTRDPSSYVAPGADIGRAAWFDRVPRAAGSFPGVDHSHAVSDALLDEAMSDTDLARSAGSSSGTSCDDDDDELLGWHVVDGQVVFNGVEHDELAPDDEDGENDAGDGWFERRAAGLLRTDAGTWSPTTQSRPDGDLG